MDWVVRFIQGNRRISGLVGQALPHTRTNLHLVYEQTVAHYMNAQLEQRIVDVGAGKYCHFAKLKNCGNNSIIIGIDVSAEEMESNQDVDEKIVADVTHRIPLPDGGIDLVVSRSTLEHIRRVEPFVGEVSRVLKPDGYTIHVFPSKHAPFSILNQLLPRRLSSILLSILVPGSKGILGFPAYYDLCTPAQMENLLCRHGFEIIETRVGYYQSAYFSFFLPFYLLSLAYEAIISIFNVRQLAANVLIVARKGTESLTTSEEGM